MLTIRPPCSFMPAVQARWIHATGAHWLATTVRRARSESMPVSGPKYGFVDALFTSTSSRPNRSMVASIAAAGASSSATLAAT